MACRERSTYLTISERCLGGLKDDPRKQVVSAVRDCVVLSCLCVCEQIDGATFLQEMRNAFGPANADDHEFWSPYFVPMSLRTDEAWQAEASSLERRVLSTRCCFSCRVLERLLEQLR